MLQKLLNLLASGLPAFVWMDNGWMFELMSPFVGEYQKSVAQYPNIKPGKEFKGYKKSLQKSASPTRSVILRKVAVIGSQKRSRFDGCLENLKWPMLKTINAPQSKASRNE